MKFKWNYHESRNLSIFEQILKNRKISESFLYSSLKDLPDMSLMKDLDKAAERIISAVHRKEKIIIYGHDDMDGITSTYLIFDFLEKIGSQNHYYYIPNRQLDCHGIQKKLIEKIEQEKIELLITVDGGISEFDAVHEIQANGTDVVITDHHLILDNKIPDAFAVINPKQGDCNYPFKMLAGVGVIYFLIRKLAEKLQTEFDKNYLFWVAVGSFADKVPLVGVNRTFMKEVLDNWHSFDDLTLEKLKPFLRPALSYHNRIFIINRIIKILSSGRMKGGQNLTMNLFLASAEEKEIIVRKLIERQQMQEEALKKSRKYLQQIAPGNAARYFIHFDKNGEIPVELLGYCTSQISKTYKIPVVFLCHKNGKIVGEGRCTEGFNLVDAFAYCQEHLIQFGGHTQAAGFTMQEKNIEQFQKKFNEYVKLKEFDIEENKRINIDAVFTSNNFNKFDEYIQMDYQLLQPFGKGNPNPHFLMKNYLPRRDYQKVKIKGSNNNLLPDECYNVVFKFKGSSFSLIDHRKANYLL
jgi:single-stranded-DNA-specific exonuclease